jgi:hypothetical protein
MCENVFDLKLMDCFRLYFTKLQFDTHLVELYVQIDSGGDVTLVNFFIIQWLSATLGDVGRLAPRIEDEVAIKKDLMEILQI